MNPINLFLPGQLDTNLTTSPLAALLIGVVAGGLLGLLFGLRLGRSIGYEPSLSKVLLAIVLVVLGAAGAFFGWHFWEFDSLSMVKIVTDPGAVENCLVASGYLTAVNLLFLVAGYPAGRRQKRAENESAKRAAAAKQLAEQAARDAEAAAALRRKAEEDAAARKRAEEEAAQAELERQRRQAEEEARRRAEEEAARARELAELERLRREQAEVEAQQREHEAAQQREAAAARNRVEEQIEQEHRRQERHAEGRKLDLAQKRNEAEAWVKGYTATAVATVLGTSWLPGASTGILCTLEATMCYHIGKIYKADWTLSEASTVAGAIGVTAFVGKLIAMEAMTFLPIAGWAAKSGIAAGVVWSMGQLVIKHFEELV